MPGYRRDLRQLERIRRHQMRQSSKRTAEDFRVEISDWGDISKLVEHFSYFNGHAWLFRGVTNESHGLKPKIGREEARGVKRKGERVPYRLNDERAVLTMFKQQARAHLAQTPRNELEWLAIAQHFGLPTRLLDWTDGLLVAIWFAVEEGGSKSHDSAIWVTKGVRVLDMDYSGEVLTLAEPYTYRPPHINPRIQAQGSVFMVCPRPTDELDLPFLKKIVIKRPAEFTIKKRLNACGINRRHLFPDLAGLSDHLAWMYKNDWLAGYTQDKN